MLNLIKYRFTTLIMKVHFEIRVTQILYFLIFIFSDIFLKKIGSGTHTVTQNSVRQGCVSYIDARKFRNAVLAHSVTKIPLLIFNK
jgi:hypothetical protein